MIPLRLPYAMACQAGASAITRPCVGIPLVERVAVFAMRLSSIGRGNANASHHVDRAGDGLHVGRIHASAGAAKVVEVESLRDSADKQLVSVTVGHHLVPAAGREAAITVAAHLSPKPTGFGFLDLRPEALYDKFRVMLGLHQEAPLSVVTPRAVISSAEALLCPHFTRSSAYVRGAK